MSTWSRRAFLGQVATAVLATPLCLRARPTATRPAMSDDALLELVQKQTFRYFWEAAHPRCLLAREGTKHEAPVVTIGGSGFGLMGMIVAAERGWHDRPAVVERLNHILDFLLTTDRFHGVFPHWINGDTGKVWPFSDRDDGADLVETSFLMQGLLCLRQYFDHDEGGERAIRDKVTRLWNEVDWAWHTRGGQNVLYWHWSPNNEWAMNHQIRGWNECLITYILAASSPTHAIEPAVYHEGFAQGGKIRNGNEYFDIRLPLGEPMGGPLFFTHYSFLGLDPRKLEDRYANYWEQNVAHSRINHAYCVQNPKHFRGYGPNCWGLTASNSVDGYDAHSPTNDLGVISPTAALSSMPYTPAESMAALRHFYEDLNDKIWGELGFADAFSEQADWVSDARLAIDQGPIVVMIENHRTGLLWNLLKRDADVKRGLERLGFRA